MKNRNRITLCILALTAGLIFGEPVGRFINQAVFLPGAEERFEALLESNPSGRYLRALKTYYPEDFELLRSKIVETVNEVYDAAGLERARRELTSVGLEIKARQSRHLRRASDASLKKVIRMNIAVAENLRDEPLLCNRFLETGPQGLPEDRLAELDDEFDMTHFLAAAHEGRIRPVVRERATARDFRALTAAFIADGGTPEEIAMLSPFDAKNPDACAAGLHFLEVLSEADFRHSDRVRA